MFKRVGIIRFRRIFFFFFTVDEGLVGGGGFDRSWYAMIPLRLNDDNFKKIALISQVGKDQMKKEKKGKDVQYTQGQGWYVPLTKMSCVFLTSSELVRLGIGREGWFSLGIVVFLIFFFVFIFSWLRGQIIASGDWTKSDNGEGEKERERERERGV